MPKRAQGFLVEDYMITVAVLAVLLALAAPSFDDSIKRARLKGAADGLVAVVQTARQQATRLNRDVSLTIRGAAGAWCVGARAAANPLPGQQVLAAPSCDCSSDATTCLVDNTQLVAASTSFGPTGGRATIDNADVDVVFDRRLGTLQDFNGRRRAEPARQQPAVADRGQRARPGARLRPGREAGLGGYRSC